MEDADAMYGRYFEDIRPVVDWTQATKAVHSGEPGGEFFTLPWWQTDSRNMYLYGTDYNRERLAELRRLPGKRMPGRGRWHTGVLYPGVPDEWAESAVGVMTQAGHVGCVAGDVCDAGLGDLVRVLHDCGQLFAVPLYVSAADVAIPTPQSQDLSAFDYPWVGSDPDQYKKAARINRSHILGLLMIKHGLTRRWRSLAERIAAFDEASGVSVSAALPRLHGGRVMVNVRSLEAAAAIRKASELAGFEAVERPRGFIDAKRAKEIGRIDALITRYPESDVPICEYARRNKIDIYRPDEFLGALAEATLRDGNSLR